jgi:hypothetical protein
MLKLQQELAPGNDNRGASTDAFLRKIADAVNNLSNQPSGDVLVPVFVTTNRLMTATDRFLVCDATAGSLTVTLVAASSFTGKSVSAKKVDGSGNTVTFVPQGVDKIEGSSSKVYNTQWQGGTFYSDGIRWLLRL